MKNKLKNLSLFFVSTSLALLLGEVIVRVFLPQNLIYHNDAVWRPDSKFGWRHHENADALVNLGEGEVSFRTDENGYRISAGGRVSSDSSSQNILVLGDSFLEAIQVENRNTVPQVLQDSLNQLPDHNTRFYNSAVAGWNPNHYFLEGQKVLKEGRLEIDLVLVFLYIANDVVSFEVDKFRQRESIQDRVFRMPRSLRWVELSHALIFPLGDYLDRNSHLYMLIKRRNRRFLTKLGLSSYYFPEVFQTKNQTSKGWETTTRICKKIASAFNEEDIPVSFILIPTTYQVNERVMEDYIGYFDIEVDSVDLEQPNKILKGRFIQNSMRLYDPLDFFRQKTENGSILYGVFDSHLNAEGHVAMAEYLLPMLTEQLKSPDYSSEK